MLLIDYFGGIRGNVQTLSSSSAKAKVFGVGKVVVPGNIEVTDNVRLGLILRACHDSSEELEVRPLPFAVPVEGSDEGSRAPREKAACRIELCATEAELNLPM